MRALTVLRALLLLLALSWCGGAVASGVFLEAGASLTPDRDSLSGEVTLTLQGSTQVYDIRVFAIEPAGRTLVYRGDFLERGVDVSVDLDLPLRHDHPGRYHLLLEAVFRDGNNVPHSVALKFPYTHVEQAVATPPPLLAIEGQRLAWGEMLGAGRLLGLALTTGPHWTTLAPIRQGDTGFELLPQSGVTPLPNWRYPQLARLDWLGADGFHYSRVIPWEILTDSGGAVIPSPRASPAASYGFPTSPVFTAGLALVALLTLRAIGLRRRGDYDALERLFGIGGVALLTLWVAAFLRVDLWLLPTWPTGGDLASHVLYAEVFREWLFQGKITGWMPEVFAGFPAFRFYFPLPFILISWLSLLLPLQVAIKLVAMLPTLLLVPAVYWLGGRLLWSIAARLFAALFAVGFIVHTGSSIWGGNLLAQLSGEFSYSWGMLFTLLFWGALARALRRGGQRWVVPALLLAAVGASHGYALLVAGFSALLLPLFYRKSGAALVTVLRVHLAAFLLLGAWLLPLAENLPYTIPNDTAAFVQDFETLLPRSLWPLLLALPALAWTLLRPVPGASGLRFLVLVAVLALCGYSGALFVGLADVRFFPFVQLCTAVALGGAAGSVLQRWGREPGLWGFALCAPLLVNWWLSGMDQIERWSAWNMAGYEEKVMWPHYRALAEHLAGDIADPRVIFEHDPDNVDTGSTRTLEALPLFGSRPVLEGLYMESAVSAPFIYQMQAEISRNPSSPLSRFPSVKGISGDIADRLQDFYVDTVVVRSRDSIDALEVHPDFRRRASFGPLVVYSLQRPVRLVEPLDAIVTLPADDWLQTSFQRYILAETGRVVFGYEGPGVGPAFGQAELLSVDREHIRFRTDAPGRPHLVRMTYHPGWRSRSGEAIYLASPSFMVVVPEGEMVELVFGPTPAQRVGLWFTAAGVLLMLLPILRPRALADTTGGRGWLVAATGLIALSGLAFAFHPNWAYLEGHEHFSTGEYTRAAKAFETATGQRRAPAHRAEALFWAARSRDLAGDPEKALFLYDRLLDEHPESFWAPESLYRVSELHRIAGDAEQSAARSERLLKQFPGNHWARRGREGPH